MRSKEGSYFTKATSPWQITVYICKIDFTIYRKRSVQRHKKEIETDRQRQTDRPTNTERERKKKDTYRDGEARVSVQLRIITHLINSYSFSKKLKYH